MFARYADDLNVYTGSKRAVDDAMATLKRLFARLRLQVNEAKSMVARGNASSWATTSGSPRDEPSGPASRQQPSRR